MRTKEQSGFKLATLKALRKEILPRIISPVPTEETLRAWFDAADVPRFKSNPFSKRGGGACYYSVPHIEQFLSDHTANGKVQQ